MIRGDHLLAEELYVSRTAISKWESGRVRHNMAESIEITTVYTTKAHGLKRDKGKGVGRIP